jgi:DNA-directed RNA polymerase specialized sigma24 family protein
MALAQIDSSIELHPVRRPAVEAALDELERVYGFIYSRVGNREDAEDLTQQVAMKALHNLRDGAVEAEVRAYLFATARSVLATFWEDRSRIKELDSA